ncbi:LysE family translocator [Acinetobacter cumulans]|uniref:LysE family translocator n=1 Tax=Acinetobacter cumulans TaxID=2136182 RepID=A0A3A8FS72_9GAMM|nr:MULTISPECIES: LysE family translocator [Acinetobacter]QCO20122.1 LysE family translocator [Acinetobacter cumulans]RKG42570.1 LysE family translocator [Acinetobacter cumulans]RKG49825.1 LysE family translocator [Acinetobacter cumulans]RLL34800.1 LysE family translocator [Acinetobacter cumulans]RZG58514.1 LysE family translocator [Acinetobacter sp. WCHAc060006]
MESLWILGSIAAALLLGAMSPGPTSIYVAKNSIAISRQHGLFTALGTGLGAAIFALLAVLGLQAFLLAVPSAYLALKICGGLYLLWMAFKIIKHAKEPIDAGQDVTAQMSLRRAFTTGLITQLSNPKIAIVLASIFTALLPKEIPTYFYFVLPLLCFFIDAGWCSLVAVALSAEKPRRIYLKFKAGFDRAAGAVMTVLGLKLIFGMK